jgi:hypothetical protein
MLVNYLSIVNDKINSARECLNKPLAYEPRVRDYSVSPVCKALLVIPKGESQGLPKMTLSKWKELLLNTRGIVNSTFSGIDNSKLMLQIIKALKIGYKPVMYRELYKASWGAFKQSSMAVVLACLDTELGSFVIGGFPQAMKDFMTIWKAVEAGEFKERFLRELHAHYEGKTFGDWAAETASEGVGGLRMFVTSFVQANLNLLPMGSGDAIRSTVGNSVQSFTDNLVGGLESMLMEMSQVDRILVDDPMQGRAYI